MSVLKSNRITIKVFGYCALDEGALADRVCEHRLAELTSLHGEYVLVITAAREFWIISSTFGVCQYYYTSYKGSIFHDDTVLGVLGKSMRPWIWNWEALAHLIQLDHLLDNETLHPDIHRVPSGSVLHFSEGRLSVIEAARPAWGSNLPASPELALEAFNDEVKRWALGDVVLSMSGGFDSRALLASLLKLNCPPLLLTCGAPNSADVIVSRQIAQAFSLPLIEVELDTADYFANGLTISRLTNGTKCVRHWHTYMVTVHSLEAQRRGIIN